MDAYTNKLVCVITHDGRLFIVRAQCTPAHPTAHPPSLVSAAQGTLKGFDQLTNLILHNCKERVFASEGATEVSFGLLVIRGDNL